MASRNSSAPGELSYERVLDRVADAVQSVLGSGRVPDQIPVLAGADPRMFGLAVATVDGEVHGVGEWRRRFSIQSISKVFTLALVIEKDGEALWTRVGREPSGTPFNSLVQLEYCPRNDLLSRRAATLRRRDGRNDGANLPEGFRAGYCRSTPRRTVAVQVDETVTWAAALPDSPGRTIPYPPAKEGQVFLRRA
jgi:Glutaminase